MDPLSAWLDHFVQQAMLLWPMAETATEASSECWLLMPEPPATTVRQPRTNDAPRLGWPAIAAWANGQSDLLYATSAVDAILLLRWRACGPA
jgi:hypothetical protein